MYKTKSPAVLYTLTKVLKDNFTCGRLFFKAWTAELPGKRRIQDPWRAMKPCLDAV